MTYSIEFTIQAEKDLARLDKPVAQQVSNKIEWLSQGIEYITPVQLKGKFEGKYKLRVGDWRVIYSYEHTTKIITVYAIRHRSEVYKI